jgi:putative FmdB family regulatory protein
MPTYEYLCRSCGERLEVVQSFADDPLTVCGACGGDLRKVFSAAGLIFKGSGWHIKDYSSSAKSPSGAPSGETSGSTSSSTPDAAPSGKAAAKSDATPSTSTSSTASATSATPSSD